MDTSEFVKIKTASAVTVEALQECKALLTKVIEENEKNDEDRAHRSYAVDYSGQLVDGAAVDFRSFDELLEYSNRGDRRLVELKMRTRPSYLPTSVEIQFGGYLTSYEAKISGEEVSVLKAKEACKNIAARVSVSYGWMHHTVTEIATPAVAYCVFFSFVAQYFIGKSTTAADAGVVSVLTLFLAGFFTFGLWAARRIAFPRIVFLLGQEKHRNDVRQYWRRWAITGVLFAVPIALAIRWFATRLNL